MEESAIIGAVSSLGFPACVSVFLLFRFSNIIERLSNNVAEQSHIIRELTNEFKQLKYDVDLLKEAIRHENIH